MENALDKINGVNAVDVDLDNESVKVNYEATKTGAKAFKEAIADAGFDVVE